MPPRSTLLPYTTLFRSRHIHPNVHALNQLARNFLIVVLDEGNPLPDRRIALPVDQFLQDQFRTLILRVGLSGKDKLNRALPIRSEEHTSELQSLRHLVCPPDLHSFPTRRSSDLGTFIQTSTP